MQIKKLRERQRSRRGEQAVAEELNVGGDVAQRRTETRQRCRAHDFDGRQLEYFGRIVGGVRARDEAAGGERHGTGPGAPLWACPANRGHERVAFGAERRWIVAAFRGSRLPTAM